MDDFAKNAVKATAGIMIITLISRVMGFVREMLIASSFGVGMITDSYRMASIIPNMLFSAIAAALGVTLIPVLSEYVHTKSTKETNVFLSNTLNISLAVAIMFMLFGIVAAELLVGIVAPGFSDEASSLTVRLIRIMFPMVIFNIMAVIASSFLHTHNKFFVPALGGLFFNLVIITQLSTLGFFGIDGLAYATLLGMLAQMIIQIPFLLQSGFKYKFSFDYKCDGVQKVFLLMLPVLMGTAISQLNATINQVIASGLPEGSISALDFGNRINGMINSMFGLSIVTVLYPSMARMAIGSQTEGLKKVVNTGIRVVSFITLPMTVGLMILSFPIVRLLFERGAFDGEATFMTSQALYFYALAIVPIGVNTVLSRAFFSLHDTKTPVIVGFLSVSLNLIMNLLIVRYMGHSGLALSTSIASAFSVFVFLLLFRRKMGLLGGREMLSSLIKQIVSCAFMGVVVFLTYRLINNYFPQDGVVFQAIRLVASVTAGAVVYFSSTYFLKCNEMMMALDLVKKVNIRRLIKI